MLAVKMHEEVEIGAGQDMTRLGKWCFLPNFLGWEKCHSKNRGTLGMVPLLFNLLYKVYMGLIIKGTIPRVPPFSP